MSDRRICDAVNELFSLLHESNELFGGKTFVFGGDWKQTLPIIQDVHGAGITEYTLIRSELWKEMTVHHLKTNHRAKDDPRFAKWILQIGAGKNFLPDHAEDVELPSHMLVHSEKQLIDTMFGNGKVNDVQCTNTSSILTIDNASSLEINEKAS